VARCEHIIREKAAGLLANPAANYPRPEVRPAFNSR